MGQFPEANSTETKVSHVGTRTATITAPVVFPDFEFTFFFTLFKQGFTSQGYSSPKFVK